jgi:hypothetical protein
MSIEAMKQALEALEISQDACIHGEMAEPSPILADAITALRQAIEQDTSAYQRGYMDGIAKGLRMEQVEQAQPVAELTDGKIYDAVYATFCIGWDRDELKAFARHIASLYTAPPPRQPLTHPQIHELDWPDGVAFEDILMFARAIEAAHGIKGEV